MISTFHRCLKLWYLTNILGAAADFLESRQNFRSQKAVWAPMLLRGLFFLSFITSYLVLKWVSLFISILSSLIPEWVHVYIVKIYPAVIFLYVRKYGCSIYYRGSFDHKSAKMLPLLLRLLSYFQKYLSNLQNLKIS